MQRWVAMRYEGALFIEPSLSKTMNSNRK